MTFEKKYLFLATKILKQATDETSDKDNIPSEMLQQFKELVDILHYMTNSDSWKSSKQYHIYDAMEVQNKIAKILEKETVKVG